jgi:hypothetical protein
VKNQLSRADLPEAGAALDELLRIGDDVVEVVGAIAW